MGKLSLWALIGLCLSCGLSDRQDGIQEHISAQIQKPMLTEIRPETIPINSTDAQKVLSWFSQGQAVLNVPYEGMLLHGCLSEKLMNILRKVLHYKGSELLTLRDVFRAQFNDYTQPFRMVGEELFHDAFIQNPRMFFQPFEELQKLRPQATFGQDMGPYTPHPSGFGLPQATIQLLSRLTPAFTAIAWDPCQAFGQTLEDKANNFHELVAIFRAWVQGIAIEWPKQMEHRLSSVESDAVDPHAARANQLDITVPSMPLGKLIDVAVKAVDRLHPEARMKALEDVAHALKALPVIYAQEPRRILPVSIVQTEDGTISRIRYGLHDLDLITVESVCIRKGTKVNLQAILDSLPAGNMLIAPDMCLMLPINNIPIPIPMPFYHDTDNRRRNDVLASGTRDGTIPSNLGGQMHGELLSRFFEILTMPAFTSAANQCPDFINGGPCIFETKASLWAPVFASQFQSTIALGWATVMKNTATQQHRLIEAAKLDDHLVEFDIVKKCPFTTMLKQGYSLKGQNPAKTSKYFNLQKGYIGFSFYAKTSGHGDSSDRTVCVPIQPSGGFGWFEQPRP